MTENSNLQWTYFKGGLQKDLTQADRLSLDRGVEKLIGKKSFVHEDLLSEIRLILETHHS
jgi:hypothetical protein